jgi:hypothetical protein
MYVSSSHAMWDMSRDMAGFETVAGFSHDVASIGNEKFLDWGWNQFIIPVGFELRLVDFCDVTHQYLHSIFFPVCSWNSLKIEQSIASSWHVTKLPYLCIDPKRSGTRSNPLPEPRKGPSGPWSPILIDDSFYIVLQFF